MKDLASLLFGPSHFFGEGGSIVQVGPKEFAAAEHLKQDPRLEAYERRGYKFHMMPNGAVFDGVFSDLFGMKVYSTTSHLDLSLGGIPEKRIVAISPHYYNDHKMSAKLMQKNLGVTLVEVPEAEADRHPQNFLPLGRGRVLVDGGSPRFIHQLKNAGIEAIPTEVPLNALIDLKGGLHCLFNEH